MLVIGYEDRGVFSNRNGFIPEEIPLLFNLKRLALVVIGPSPSNFRGSIPTTIGRLPQLTDLNMDDSQFEGSIPSEVGKLTNLVKLDFDNNDLALKDLAAS
jgi:hypothetical protein